MIRVLCVFLAGLLVLTACTPGPSSSARPGQGVYRISRADAGKVQYRMLDAVNALRSASGAQALALDPRLNAAAATHSRDMSAQNRPWHFGSDGSSPIQRVARAGFSGQLVGENISETYETELETLGAWMDQSDTRRVILSRSATRMGFSWFQESNGKIWWTLILGT